MKVKNKNSRLFIVLLLVILVGITIIFVFNYVIKGSSKIYHSNDLQFTIMVPFSFSVDDKSIQVNLISPKGNISIIRNGTNYLDLNDYLKEFDSRVKIVLKDVREGSINGYSSITRIETFPSENNSEKAIYIYTGNAVYILSADSPELYDELDQIAESFKYTGN